MKLKIVRPTAVDAAEPKAKEVLKRRDIVARWGGNEAILASGFVAVPVLLLERMSLFKPYSLTPAEVVFIVCVMAHKWDERHPFPSYKRIATWMAKSESYVRRLAKNLAAKGLVDRLPRVGQSNEFDFRKLFAKILEPEASGKTQQRGPRQPSITKKTAPKRKRLRAAG